MCVYIYIYTLFVYVLSIVCCNCSIVSQLGSPESVRASDSTPGLHNKIPALKIFARGWVAQESFVLHYQR